MYLRKGRDMITATRITRALGVLGVVGLLAHATTSLATSGAAYQDPGPAPEPAPAASAVDDAPLPGAPEPVKDLPPPPDEPALDLAVPPASPILESKPLGAIKPEAAPAASPAPLPDDETDPLPPARELKPRPSAAIPPAPRDPVGDEFDRPAARPEPRAAEPDFDPADDPDADARSFVERNRREAQEQLKGLREEAARLKGRLARVEAGIRRWEALADAMERGAQDKTAAATGDDPRAIRATRGVVQYGIPVGGGVIIQSQPVTRSDFVPVPGPR